MRLKLFNFIHCLFKWISVKLPIRPVSGLGWIMINPNKSFDLRTLVNMFQLCGDRKEEYPYFDLDCILCFLVFSTIWTRKVSISVNCSWNMYRFLQVISFLSFIFKKVLYIRMTINFTVYSSVSCSNPVSFCFLCRSPHNLLTSFIADFWVLYSVIGKKTISFKVFRYLI